MRKSICWITVMGCALVASPIAQAIGEDGCCAHCGCATPCQKVCRLVCEEKKVEVVCWGCQCEEFCVPGPSKHDCRHCEAVCETCGEDTVAKVCSLPKKFVWTEWLPRYAQIHTKKKLMKKIVTVSVPSHKWVTEDLCSACAVGCGGSISTGAEVSPTPSDIFPAPPLPSLK